MANVSGAQREGEYPIPGFFVPHIERYVTEMGGDARALYTAADLDRALFQPEEHSVSETQLHALIASARAQLDEPALGFEIGSRFSISSFGLLSRALMSCASLQEVARMLERYSVLVLPLVRFSTLERGQHSVVEVNALSRYPLLNQVIFEALLACWDKIVRLLVGQEVLIDRVVCSFDAPDHAQRYTELGVGKVEFSGERNLMFLRSEYASLALSTANPIDALATREACEKALIKSRQTRTLVEQVNDHLRYYLDTSPGSAEVAARLNMSERTFRRRLAEEGTSYRQLLNAVRRDIAIYYLEQTQLQVAVIALKLGYQETSNFRAAFKTWTGVSPRAWRQRSQSK